MSNIGEIEMSNDSCNHDWKHIGFIKELLYYHCKKCNKTKTEQKKNGNNRI